MAELLFGTGPQIWPSVPAPGLGHLPSFPANRAAMIFQGTPSDAPQTPMNPGIAPFDFAAGITPQALLANVALRRGQPTGPANDQDVEDFIYDALDLLPGANDIEVRCDSGRVMLTGSVPHKRAKRDAGEIAWAIPSANDVQNNITIATRRRSRTQVRESEPSSASASRKPA
jgi:BON domain-containing protein